MPSNLESRLKRVEEALKPEAGYLTVHRYSCMRERDVQAAIRDAKRRVPPDVEVTLVIILTEYADCPKGPHRHTPRQGQLDGRVVSQEW